MNNSSSISAYPSVEVPAAFICDEIKRNVKSDSVRELRKLNGGMNSKRGIIDITQQKKKAYLKFAGFVNYGGDWDHKSDILELQDRQHWACDHRMKRKFRYDIWSNIHYGFIGRYAGFTEFELTSGAGVAQVMGNWRRIVDTDLIGDSINDTRNSIESIKNIHVDFKNINDSVDSINNSIKSIIFTFDGYKNLLKGDFINLNYSYYSVTKELNGSASA